MVLFLFLCCCCHSRPSNFSFHSFQLRDSICLGLNSCLNIEILNYKHLYSRTVAHTPRKLLNTLLSLNDLTTVPVKNCHGPHAWPEIGWDQWSQCVPGYHLGISDGDTLQWWCPLWTYPGYCPHTLGTHHRSSCLGRIQYHMKKHLQVKVC